MIRSSAQRVMLPVLALLAVFLHPGTEVQGQQWYGSAEYLAWWVKGNHVPALVTTSPTGTARMDAGVLGTPGAQVLFGDGRIDGNVRHGGRIMIGHWLEAHPGWGVEVDYLALGDGANDNYFNSSTGDPILARPFFNVVTPGEDAQLVAFPSVVEGGITILTSSEFHSVEILTRYNYRQGTRGYLDLLAGYRYVRFREGLSIREDLISVDPAGFVQIGTEIDVIDSFVTENDFHGGEIGAVLGFEGVRWGVDFTAKAALGDMREQVTINGRTEVTTPSDPTVTSTGGLLALPSNIGTFTAHELVAIPELEAKLRYFVTDSVQLTLGYNLIFLTKVLRTGEQIDRNVDPSQLSPALGGGGGPGARPTVQLNDTSMWMQGVFAGAEVIY